MLADRCFSSIILQVFEELTQEEAREAFGKIPERRIQSGFIYFKICQAG
ncbi:hypothetical protein AB1K84_18625 [Mesobacillus foraminis]